MEMINMCTKNLWGALNERVEKKNTKKVCKDKERNMPSTHSCCC